MNATTKNILTGVVVTVGTLFLLKLAKSAKAPAIVQKIAGFVS